MQYWLIKVANMPGLSADGGQAQKSNSQGERGKLQRVWVPKRDACVALEVKGEPDEEPVTAQATEVVLASHFYRCKSEEQRTHFKEIKWGEFSELCKDFQMRTSCRHNSSCTMQCIPAEVYKTFSVYQFHQSFYFS